MKIVILIHGYNVVNLEKTVGILRPYFEAQGYVVENLSYGFVPFVWQLEKKNPKVAKRLSSRIAYWQNEGAEEIVLVGHSNGCAIAYQTDNYYYNKIKTMIAVNPALDRKEHPYKSADKVFVLHNNEDKVVVKAKWLMWVAEKLNWGWLKPIPWGEMGRTGFKGLASNVTNVDTGKGKEVALGHSGVFKSHFYLQQIVNLCEG